MRRNIDTIVVVVVALTTINASSGEELRMLNVLFRHGDRTPDSEEKYPTDPYLSFSFYPIGRGQLTRQGMQREFQLGSFLRQRYNEFLGDEYRPHALRARSSDYDRTKASLQLVLAAMYPPRGYQVWNPDLNWQPIPFEYARKETDELFLGDGQERYLRMYRRTFETPAFQREFVKYESLLAKLSIYTGKNITSPMDVATLYHSLVATQAMNLPLPCWSRTLFPQGALYEAMLFSYKAANYNLELRRMYGGLMLRTFVNNLLDHVNNRTATTTMSDNNNNNVFLYSGHETNIASLLHSLKVFTPHAPKYSSSIIMELVWKEDHHCVRVLYYTGIPAHVKTLRVPGCQNTCCRIEIFLEAIAIELPLKTKT